MKRKQLMHQPKYRLWDYESETMEKVTNIVWDCVGNIEKVTTGDSDCEGEWEYCYDPEKDFFIMMLDTGCEDAKGKLVYDFDVTKDISKTGEVIYCLIFFHPEELKYKRCIVELESLKCLGTEWELDYHDIVESEIIGNIFEDKELRKIFDKFLKESRFFGLGDII